MTFQYLSQRIDRYDESARHGAIPLFMLVPEPTGLDLPAERDAYLLH